MPLLTWFQTVAAACPESWERTMLTLLVGVLIGVPIPRPHLLKRPPRDG